LLQGYHEQFTEPENNWPKDVCRGLVYLNKDLFKTGSSIKGMKEKNGTPQNNFSMRFKRYVGRTPRDYKTYHRINASLFLLSDEKLIELSIGNIGWLVGYENPQTFSMVFKSKTQLSPGKWRKRRGNSGKNGEKNEEKI